MLKITVAHSLTADAATVADALAKKVSQDLGGIRPDVALLFATIGMDHAGLLKGLAQLLPGCPLVGCSSCGEVSHQQGYRVGSSVLIAFASDTIQFRAGALRDLTFDDMALNASRAEAQLQLLQGGTLGLPIKTEPVLGLLFPDGLGLDGESVVQLFASHFPSTRFFGGAAAEDFRMNPTDQLFNTEVLHNAVPYEVLAELFSKDDLFTFIATELQ